jgi:hypothetical protein
MGLVKPGDIVCIKNPERNSLVKAGKLELRVPDISAVVPESISRQDLKLLDSLIEWGILELREELISQPFELDPLDEGLLEEYRTLTVKETVHFLRCLSDSRRNKFLQYEKGHKNRSTVLRAFQC